MQFISSNKKTVQWLIKAMLRVGIKRVVISPGSRNAPLIISLSNHPNFECYNIVDERSAAFYALGMAKQSCDPVAIVCTSGSAVLNYAPAISEAFYAEIPLLVITADRPPELIDQEDGQTIHQVDVFKNYIKNSIALPTSNTMDEAKKCKSDLAKTLDQLVSPTFGPIHVNIPFNEPLYETESIGLEIPEPTSILKSTNKVLVNDQLLKTWNKAKSILIVCGMMSANKLLEDQLNQLNKLPNIAVLASALSNLNGTVSCSIESVVYNNKPNELLNYKPDLLITIGGPIVSKALKQFIRKFKPKHHWDIDTNPKIVNTYQCLSHKFTNKPEELFNVLLHEQNNTTSSYNALWQIKRESVHQKRNQYEACNSWNDFTIFSTFLKNINTPIDLHLSNSTPVRYAELFDKHPLANYYCNRGVSGIDGSTSTAAGFAIASGKKTVLITGDLSFLYDSNALWNNHLPANLKIIVINNQGGNIFKIIKGPNESDQLDQFQANTPAKISALCAAFNIDYLNASNTLEFENSLQHLFNCRKCTVLEVITHAEKSAQSYRNYFKYLMD